MTKPKYELIDGKVFFRGRCFVVEFKTKDKAREAAKQVGLKPGQYILKGLHRDVFNRPTAWEIETIETAMQEVRRPKRKP